MLGSSVPGSGTIPSLAYLPAADQANATTINALFHVTTMHSNNAGTDCYLYVDGIKAGVIGFDTSSDNEWRNGTITVPLSPATHTIDYGCNLGYVAGIEGVIVSYQ